MGQRREPRKSVEMQVRVFGTDTNGKPFTETVAVHNISRHGCGLQGLQARVKPGEIVGITFETRKARFTVRWAAEPGSPEQGKVGLEAVSPETSIWNVELPAASADEFGHKGKGAERRIHPRVRSLSSIELHPEGGSAPIWGKALDLSVGGCFVEMPMPLPKGTKLKIGLWIQEAKIWIKGDVVNSRPGFGIGIRFREMETPDAARLKQFLSTLSNRRI